MSGAGVGIGTGTGGSTGRGSSSAADGGRRVVVTVGLLLLLLLVLGGHRVRRQHYKVGERDVGSAATFEGDRVLSEVLEHLRDRGEPEVLDAALA